MKHVMIIGATSAIAEATARIYAQSGAHLALVARNEQRLQSMAQDLTLRGAGKVVTRVMDVNEVDKHKALLDGAISELGGLDAVLIAHGTLPDQTSCQQSFELVRREFNINAL